ncbi:MAG: TolC family outer membrane protein [Luteimonas sp.]
MLRHRLALALALAALLPAAASAEDLLQTYELARTGDPQLRAAESTRLATKENAVQARANLLPQINGSASLSRSWSTSNGQPQDIFQNGVVIGRTTGNSESNSRGRDYGVNLSQSVFDWSRISTLRSRRALNNAADFDLENANDTLVTRTSAAYFNVLVAIETLAAAEASETALKRQFDYADKRLEVGLAPITDVHEARAQYDSARANTIAQRNTLQDTYQSLTEITGTSVVNLKALPEDFRPQLPSDKDVDAWVASAVADNPTLKSLEAQVQSSEFDISTAKAGHLPYLDLTGQYGKSAAWGTGTEFADNGLSASRSLGNDSKSRSLTLTLTVPIYSGGATQSRVRQAVAQRDITQDQYEQQKRAVIRNTRNAYQVLVAGISAVEARRLAVFSANAAYEASQVGLEVGTRTVLDVLINQQTLFNARQDYAIAKYDYLQNRLLLDQSAGSLDVADIQDVNRLLTVNADAQLAPDGDAATPPRQ